jgi:methyl-accepting chemotaxis protein PixJ
MVDQFRTKPADSNTPSKLPTEPPIGKEPLPKLEYRSPKRHGQNLKDWVARLGLGTKTTLLAIAIGTLPVIAIGGLAYQVADQKISDQITKSEQSRTVGLADKVNRFMDDRISDLQILAKLPTFVSPTLRASTSREDKNEVLTSFVQAKGFYDSAAVFDLNGEPIAQSIGTPVGNHSDREYFRQVINTRTPVVSSPQKSQTTGEMVIHLAAPIFDSGESRTLIGVVRTRLPISKVNDVARNFAVNGEHYHLSDRNGLMFLVSDQIDAGDIGKPIGEIFPALNQSMVDRKEMTRPGWEKGSYFLLSYAPFKQLGETNLLYPG